VDVIDEAALAVDLDDRNPLAVRRLELLVAVDRDLPQLEAELGLRRGYNAAGGLAEVAARRREKRYLGYG
jgi:hypothetical protein